MYTGDLDAIEQRLGVRLPRFYREFVSNYPNLPEDSSDIAAFEILDDPARLIALNEALRSGIVPGLAWPEGLFVVGESGCGDYYAIGLDGQSEAVLCWNHEHGEFEESSASLKVFVKGLVDGG